jgi:hypothetical protein
MRTHPRILSGLSSVVDVIAVRRRATLLLILATVTASFLADGTLLEAAKPLVQCKITATESDGFLRLDAFGRSDTPISGSYSFQIDKHDSAGSSLNQQSGDFSLRPGVDQIVTTVMLEAAAKEHYSASLLLTWDGGKTSCRSP